MEYIYIAKNSLIKNMVKIGRTKNLERRLSELNQLLPEPFIFIKTYEVKNSSQLELHIHKALDNVRSMSNREFFEVISDEQIIQVCDDLVADFSHFNMKDKHKSIVSLDKRVDLSSILRSIRVSKGVTQEELASKSGLSHATIVRFESAKTDMSLVNILAILEVLDCNLYLGLSDDKNSERRRVRKYYKTTAP